MRFHLCPKRSCFKEEKTRFVNKDVYGDVKYKELKLPTPKNMARQWAEGIAKEKEKLWDIICAWTTDYFDAVTQKFNRSIDKSIKLADRAFEKQYKHNAGFEPNINPMDRRDAFRDLANQSPKITVSPRLSSEAYGNEEFYSR